MVGPQDGMNAWGELPGDLGRAEERRGWLCILILTVLGTLASKQCRFVATNFLDRGNEASPSDGTEIRAH